MREIQGVVWENGKRVRRKIKLNKRYCDFCGAYFQPLTQKSKFCSRNCGKKAEYQKNRERYIENSKKWYSDNKDRAKQTRKEAYWRDPEGFRERSRAYRKQNVDRYKELNDEYHDAIRFGGLRSDVLALYENECAWCGSRGSLVVHHRNHNKEDNQIKNLILLCRSCHLKAHDPLYNRWGKPTQFKE